MMRSTISLPAISLALILFALVGTAFIQSPSNLAVTVTPSLASSTEEPLATSTPLEEGGNPGEEAAEAVAARTPQPSPTPSPIKLELQQVITEIGFDDVSILGLSIENWIDLSISVLIVIFGYRWGARLIIGFLKWVLDRLGRDFDDSILKDVITELNWLATLYFSTFAINRLEFISESSRIALNDLMFVLKMIMIAIIALKLINTATTRYEMKLSSKMEMNRLSPIIESLERVADLLVLVVILSLVLSHFGMNVNVIAAILLVLGVIIALGAQSTISDIINGFIILIDQPFQPGNVILIEELETTGRVLEIGTRTTRIQTGDNRMVVIPNSKIGASQVINYSYPDPIYRLEADLGIAYGSDMERVRKVIRDSIQAIEGVLLDKSVQIYFLEYGDSSRLVRVRWWIENYDQHKPMLDKVNTALEVALDKAGIEMPNQTIDQNIKIEPSLIQELKRPEQS